MKTSASPSFSDTRRRRSLIVPWKAAFAFASLAVLLPAGVSRAGEDLGASDLVLSPPAMNTPAVRGAMSLMPGSVDLGSFRSEGLTAAGNGVWLGQTGRDNVAVVAQSGQDNLVLALQQGAENTLAVSQAGVGGRVDSRQSGQGNQAEAIQTGGASLLLMQAGADHLVRVTQTGGGAAVVQTGR